LHSAGSVEMGPSGFAMPNWNFGTARRQNQAEVLSPTQPQTTSYESWTPVEPTASYEAGQYIGEPSQPRMSPHVVPQPMPFDVSVQVPCQSAQFPLSGLPMAMSDARMHHYGQTPPPYQTFPNGPMDQHFSPMTPMGQRQENDMSSMASRQDPSMSWSQGQ